MSAPQNLLTATTQLEEALAAPASGRGPDWKERLARALADMEAAVEQHSRALASRGGRMIDVDRPMVQAPGFLHQMDKLREEMKGFLEETRSLRGRVQTVAPPAGTPSVENLAGALEVAPEVGAVADFGVFCQRARALVQALQHFEEEESDLILRSVNTDIGAGD
jgi:hypothetical protein